MNKIIINPRYCSREEYQELKDYLTEETWDWQEVSSGEKINSDENIVFDDEFLNILDDEWFKDRAESHIEAWEDRYHRKKIEDIKFDLNQNHDISLELEQAKEDIKRELTSKEEEYVTNTFNEAVVNNYYL